MPLKLRSYDSKIKVPAVPPKETAPSKNALTQAKQRKLEEILQKEMLRTKSEQLKTLLTKKMTLKYGRIHTDVIAEVVNNYISGSSKVTSEDLSVLEKRVQDAVKAHDTDNTNKAKQEPERTEQVTESNQREETRESQRTSNTPSGSAAKLAKGAEWQIIATYDKIIAEERDRKVKEKARQTRSEFKKTLDDHIQLSKDLRKSENNDDIEYSKHITEDVQKFQIEQIRRRQEVKDKNLELMRLRKEQYDDQQRRKREEKIKAREFEQTILATAEERMAREKEIIQASKLRDREMRMQIERDNVENKRIQKILRDKEREEDHRLMQEYSAKLDREAYERDNAFKMRMEHIDRSSLKFALEGAGKIAGDEEKAREVQQMKELERAIERERAEFQRKENEKKMRLQKMLQENERLVEVREREKRLEQEAREKLAQKYKEDQEILSREAEEAKKIKLKKQLEYNSLLSRQLAEREENRVRTEEMVEREKALNKKKLTKALKNEDIVKYMSPKQKSLAPKFTMSPI